jgi:hypothetical protein
MNFYIDPAHRPGIGPGDSPATMPLFQDYVPDQYTVTRQAFLTSATGTMKKTAGKYTMRAVIF